MQERKDQKTQQKKNSKSLFFFLILSSFVFQSSCTSDKVKQKQVDLPFYGHHDVVYQASEEYEVGDTVYHTVPQWEYLTHDSVLLNSRSIENKIWIADFFFSYCPTICPPMTKAMRGVSDSLSAYQKDLAFLSFSIDPDRDTPARLRLYRERHEITADNWYFLTGDEAETHALGIDGFQLFANADEQAPGGFAHSSNFVLIDENQHIRGIYDGLDPDSRKQLIKDAKLLLNAK